jgi:transposase-like protein
MISGQKNLSEICREYKLNQQMVSRWKTEFLQNAPSIFERKNRYSDEQQRIAELEQVLGRKTMELEIAKKAFDILEQTDTRNGR